MSNKEYKRIYAREWRKKHPGYNSLYPREVSLTQIASRAILEKLEREKK